MPSIYTWMFGVEFDRALRITAWSEGYWTPTATDDLLALGGVTGFLGLLPASDRELEVLWVEEDSPGAIAMARPERGNWSRISASVLLALYPAFRVRPLHILRLPYVVRNGHLFLQLDQWKVVPSTPEGYTTADKARSLRRARRSRRKPK